MIDITIHKKNYGSKEVLKDMKLTIHPGKVYGLVGENGAGKTTLFKCIAGLEGYHGKIESGFDPLKNHIGFLPTVPFIFSRITGREYLKLLCQARQVANPKIDQKNIFNLPLNEYAIHYSSGMKKKLALTGVLLQKNDFYILDEPFNGVDIHSNMLITEIIQKLKNLNKYLLISSHILESLTDIADEILLLKHKSIGHRYVQSEYDELGKNMQPTSIQGIVDRLELE